LDSFHEFFSNVKIKYCIGRNGEPLMIKCEVIEPDEIETWNYFDNFGTPKKEEEDPSSQSEADDAQDETYKNDDEKTDLLTELVDLKTEESQVAQPQKTFKAKRRKKGSGKAAVSKTARRAKEKVPEKSERTKTIEEYDQMIREVNDMKCSLCSFQFVAFWQVKHHFRKVHKMRTGYLVCCGTKYRKRIELVEHIKWHKNPDMFRCEACNRSFKGRAILVNHNLRMHTIDPEPSNCPHCDKTFINTRLLNAHVALHLYDDKEPDVECDICKKLYKSEAKMLMHKNIRHSGETFMCELCSKIFESRGGLSSHMKSHIPDEERERVQCELCSHWLQKGMSYKSHMRKHKSGPQKCTICDKELKNPNCLRAHMTTVHNDDKKYKCKICDKAFHNKKKLVEHEAANHTFVDLYKCQFCGVTS